MGKRMSVHFSWGEKRTDTQAGALERMKLALPTTHIGRVVCMHHQAKAFGVLVSSSEPAALRMRAEWEQPAGATDRPIGP